MILLRAPRCDRTWCLLTATIWIFRWFANIGRAPPPCISLLWLRRQNLDDWIALFFSQQMEGYKMLQNLWTSSVWRLGNLHIFTWRIFMYKTASENNCRWHKFWDILDNWIEGGENLNAFWPWMITTLNTKGEVSLLSFRYIWEIANSHYNLNYLLKSEFWTQKIFLGFRRQNIA